MTCVCKKCWLWLKHFTSQSITHIVVLCSSHMIIRWNKSMFDPIDNNFSDITSIFFKKKNNIKHTHTHTNTHKSIRYYLLLFIKNNPIKAFTQLQLQLFQWIDLQKCRIAVLWDFWRKPKTLRDRAEIVRLRRRTT